MFLEKQGSYSSKNTPRVPRKNPREFREIDLIMERDDGAVIAVEMKASRRVAAGDLRATTGLRELLGDRFAYGLILYLGERAYVAADRIAVLPLDRLWTATGGGAPPVRRARIR